MSRWFRHYAGMMRDDKLVRVAIRSGQSIERVVWIYGAILESAAEIDDGGRYDFDSEEAAYFLRTSVDDVLAVENALRDSGRLDKGFVAKWGDRQFQSDRSAQRQARYRERKKEANINSEQAEQERQRDGEVTSPKRHRDAPETETETETENTLPNGRVPVSEELQGEIVEAWNLTAGRFNLPKVRTPLSPERKRKLAARIRQHPDEGDWHDFFGAIEKSPFLQGATDRFRGATFDFMLQPSSFQKAIEGNYGRSH